MYHKIATTSRNSLLPLLSIQESVLICVVAAIGPYVFPQSATAFCFLPPFLSWLMKTKTHSGTMRNFISDGEITTEHVPRASV